MTGFEVEAHALTLFERIHAWHQSGRPAAGGQPSGATRRVVERWRTAVAGGSQSVFARRLSWDGLSEKNVATALDWAASHPAEAAASGPRAGWWQRLEDTLARGQEYRRCAAQHGERAPSADGPLAPLLGGASAGVRAVLEDHEAVRSGVVGRSAVDDLVAHLEGQLAALTTPAANALASAAGIRPADRRAWAEDLESTGLRNLWLEFPVLARHVQRLLETAAAADLELFDRLMADRSALSTLPRVGPEPGTVSTIIPGLSDRHAGGRRVAVVGFDHGSQVVYKPRTSTMDTALAGWLEWAAGEGLAPVPQLPKVLSKPGYGWSEFVAPLDVPSEGAVPRWFESAGVLLALAHALAGSDLHAENVVAGSASPILLDVETFLCPELHVERTVSLDATSAHGRVASWVRTSFLSTGLLTFLEERDDGRVVDIGGLCGEVARWSGDRREVRSNDPTVGGVPHPIAGHASEVRRGFEAAYRFLMKHRERLVDRTSLATWFDGAESRVLLRPTRVYARLLNLWCEPRCQRSGLTIGPAMESLHRRLAQREERPPGWDLVADERRQMEALDVPRFTVAWDDDRLCGSSGTSVRGLVRSTGRTIVEGRIRGFDGDDLKRQLELLDLTLASMPHPKRTVQESAEGSPVDTEVVERLSTDALTALARDLGDQLLAAMVRGDDGSVLWLDPVHLRPDGSGGRVAWASLYNGAAGVAVFLAALSREFPGRGYGTAARDAIASVARVLEAPRGDPRLQHEPLGACNGLGGLIYGCVLAAHFLDDREMAERAAAGVHHVDAERIGGDCRLDVEGGSAGAILGLLALDAAVGSTEAVAAVAGCAEHLMATRRAGSERGAAWPAANGRLLAGFAHGASGVALALTRAWRRVGNQAWRRAAEGALAFEDTLFDPNTENWPVVPAGTARSGHEGVTFTAWCHGAPGIALARTAAMAEGGPGGDEGLLEAAIRTTRGARIGRVVHLCCGTLGGIDALMTIGQFLGRPELQRMAETRMAMAIRVGASMGAMRLGHGAASARPGFFRGLAGIGYELLRVARPEVHPSVLAFQQPSGGDA
jgi:lantibiotic modifying enzyme